MNERWNEEFIAPLDGLRFSDEAKRRMTRRLAEEPPRPVSVRRRPARVLLAACAAALLLICASLGVLAYGGEGAVSGAFRELFGIGPDTEALAEAMGSAPGVSVTDGGVRVSADAVLGDAYHYAVVFSIEREDGKPFDLTGTEAETGAVPVMFESFRVYVQEPGPEGGSLYFYDADPSDASLQMVYAAETAGSVRGKTVTAQFQRFLRMGRYEDTLLSDGTWELSFPLDFEDTTVRLGTSGTPYSLVTVSPLGYHVEYNGLFSRLDSGELLPVTLRLTDGTAIDMEEGTFTTGLLGWKATQGGIFDRIIPVEDMKSIVIGDTELAIANG